MTVLAIRCAVQVDADERASILEGTTELVSEVVSRNGLTPDDVISVLFTVTSDLRAEFPALAARKIGFGEVPLMCATEIPVPGALPRVVRLMMHVVKLADGAVAGCGHLAVDAVTDGPHRHRIVGAGQAIHLGPPAPEVVWVGGIRSDALADPAQIELEGVRVGVGHRRDPRAPVHAAILAAAASSRT